MAPKRTADDGPSDYVKQVAAEILRVMRKHGQLRFADMVKKVDANIKTSNPSMYKALGWLRDEHNAPLRYDNRDKTWILTRRDFSLPLLDPSADDIVAVAFAGALLSPLGDANLDRRIQSLLEELDERAAAVGKGRRLKSHAVMATASATMPVDSRVVATLARAVGREAVRITYTSPWAEETTVKTHVVEPWQLRVHDANLYLRGWLRSKSVPSTFRVAQIKSIVAMDEPFKVSRPPLHEIWGEHGPGKGVDIDRPSKATIRVRGPMARYVKSAVWHDEQKDSWVEKNQVLEREFAYESCRATARKLLGLGDALDSVEPKELREELARHVGALSKVTG